MSEVGVDVSPSDPLTAQRDAIDRGWLRAKGRFVKELTFLVGSRHDAGASMHRMFVATDVDGTVHGYLTFMPAYGKHPGWLLDLSRRRPDSTPGTSELLTLTVNERFRSEHAAYFHFGLTPSTGLSHDHELPGHSRATARLAHLLADHGRRVYPAASQVAYKLKWSPDVVQPEYAAFLGRVSPRSIWRLLRMTNALQRSVGRAASPQETRFRVDGVATFAPLSTSPEPCMSPGWATSTAAPAFYALRRLSTP